MVLAIDLRLSRTPREPTAVAVEMGEHDDALLHTLFRREAGEHILTPNLWKKEPQRTISTGDRPPKKGSRTKSKNSGQPLAPSCPGIDQRTHQDKNGSRDGKPIHVANRAKALYVYATTELPQSAMNILCRLCLCLCTGPAWPDLFREGSRIGKEQLGGESGFANVLLHIKKKRALLACYFNPKRIIYRVRGWGFYQYHCR